MLSPVRLSVVYNVRAPYSGGLIFGKFSTAFGALAIVPGEPLRRGS